MTDRAGPQHVDAMPASVSALVVSKLPTAFAGAALAAPATSDRAAAPPTERDAFGAGFDLGNVRADSLTGRMPLLDELGHANIGPQLRPLIGAVDDQFEHEADRIASQALGVPTPPAAAPSDAAEMSPDPAELGEAPVDEAELTSGGAPIPEHLRTFFEGRLGFDLGHVRVHQGDDARALNDTVAARAFTYANHVWLGRGEQLAPTFTLAHELTHVVQQTQPQTLHRRALGQAARSLQRIPYWTNTSNTNPHNDITHELGKKIFEEAPMTTTVDPTTVGWADLYSASTALGVTFPLVGAPVSPWKVKGGVRNTLFATTPFDRDKAAPVWDDTKKQITKVAQAPTKILIGDVKPVPWSSSYLGSPLGGFITTAGWAAQKAKYAQGITETAKNVNLLVGAGKSNAKKTWADPKLDDIPPAQLAIPSKWTVGSKSGTSETLALFEGGKRVSPQPAATVTGKLKVFTKKSHDGVWHYAYIPDPKSLTAAARTEKPVDDLAKEVQALIALMTTPPDIKPSPVAAKKRAAPHRGRPSRMANRQLARVARDHGRRIRRERKPPEKDTFDLNDWKTKQTALIAKKKTLETTSEWKDALGQKKAYDAHVQLAKLVDIGEPPTTLKKNADEVGKAEFWLSWKGKLLARLRRAFGGIYIKIAKAFYAIKKRVVDFFKSTTAKMKGDKWWQKVIQIAWKIIKWAAPKLMSAVFNTLWEALARGVIEKIKAYFPVDEVEDEIRGEAKDLAKELGFDNVDDALDEGNIAKVADKIGEDLGFGEQFHLFEDLVAVADLLSDLATLVSLLKWAARIAAAGSQCAWPPGIGCLKILLLPLVEYGAEKLFEKIAETCWFQGKVATAVADLDVFKYFGKKIGVWLIQKIQTASPKLGSFFKIDDVANEAMNPDEYPCVDEISPGGQSFGTDQQQLAEWATEMGEARIRNLAGLMQKLDDPNAPGPTKDEVKQLVDTLRNEPKPGGGMREGGRLNNPKAEQKPGDAGPPKNDPTSTKPKDADDGAAKPADDGVKGTTGAPKTPTPGKSGEKVPGTSDKSPDVPPITPNPNGQKQPGDNKGTDEPGGKTTSGTGKQSGGSGKSSTGQGSGPTPLQTKAERLAQRLKQLRDMLEQAKQGGSSSSSSGGTSGTSGSSGSSGTDESGSGATQKKKQGGAGGPTTTTGGGSAPTPKGGTSGGDTPTPAQPKPDVTGGEGDDKKPSDPAKGDGGAKPDAGGGDPPPSTNDQKDPKQKDPKDQKDDKGPPSKSDGKPATGGDDDAGTKPPEKGDAKSGGAAQPAPKKDGKADDAPKRKSDPVDEMIDLLDALIQLLEAIKRGELKDDGDIDAAIALLVANAKAKVQLDPNAKRIIFVFEALGGSVEEDLGIKRKPPQPDDDVVAQVEALGGDPQPKQGQAPPPPPDQGDDPDEGEADIGPNPKKDAPPPLKGGSSGNQKPPPGAGKAGDQKKGDKGDPKLPVFDFDPIPGGYFVGITPQYKGILVLSADGKGIVNPKGSPPPIVAHIVDAGSGQVQLVSGTLIKLLTDLARKLPDKPWTGDGEPIFKMSFYEPNYVTNDDPDAQP